MLKDIIIGLVERKGPIKAVDLALDTMGIINPMKFESAAYHNVINQLIKEEEIIELEYVEPAVPYRIKSLFFQKGTTLERWNETNMDRDSERNSTIPHQQNQGRL